MKRTTLTTIILSLAFLILPMSVNANDIAERYCAAFTKKSQIEECYRKILTPEEYKEWVVKQKVAADELNKSPLQKKYENALKNPPIKIIAKAVSEGYFFVEYFAIGYAMSATYVNQSGATEQKDLSEYWYKTMILPKGAHTYLSVQNKTEYGSVGIIIRINGRIFQQVKSNTDYGIASGSAILSNQHRNFLFR